jgi:hypothetical protein
MPVEDAFGVLAGIPRSVEGPVNVVGAGVPPLERLAQLGVRKD